MSKAPAPGRRDHVGVVGLRRRPDVVGLRRRSATDLRGFVLNILHLYKSIHPRQMVSLIITSWSL